MVNCVALTVFIAIILNCVVLTDFVAIIVNCVALRFRCGNCVAPTVNFVTVMSTELVMGILGL